MDYIRFGQTGLKVSRLCLGTMSMGSSAWKGWVLDEDSSIPILRRAVDLGITFFDMADWYSGGRNEEVVGRNLLKMSPRERLVLATKVYYPMSDDPNDRGLSRKHIATAIDRSLARMGTDYVDLYVIHAFDAETPVEETMEALHATVRAGKVRYLGASTMYAWQFAKMNHVAAMNGWTPFVNMQCQYNVLYREEEREMLPCCRDQGIAVTTFSPLARGFLAPPPAGLPPAPRRHRARVPRRLPGILRRRHRSRDRTPGAGGCRAPGREHGARRDGVGRVQHLPQHSDRGRRESGAPRRRRGGVGAAARCRGKGLPRGPLPAARRNQRPEAAATSPRHASRLSRDSVD
jgi:aryl-alcohol dehydrogenase-like predicted oxidoreductase